VYAIFNIAGDLGPLFAPFALESLNTLSALVDFQYLDSIRNIASVALPKLVKCLIADAALASAKYVYFSWLIFFLFANECTPPHLA